MSHRQRPKPRPPRRLPQTDQPKTEGTAPTNPTAKTRNQKTFNATIQDPRCLVMPKRMAIVWESDEDDEGETTIWM